ncbi:MAG: WD40 repeat domain-containing protein [Planctomycetaceae bacterium]
MSEFPDRVTSLAFSPDGSLLAAGSYDEVRLIDPTTRKAVETLKTRNGYVRGLAFSADGSRLAVGDYQSLSLWDVKAARRVKTLSGHTGYVTAVVFVGDRLVSGSEDGTLRAWIVATGKHERTIDVGVPVNDVAVSPDDAFLAVAAGDTTRPNRSGSVMLWNASTAEKVADLVGHERAALAVAFHPDGTRLVSAGEDEKVNLHDVPGRKAVGYYAGHSRSVNDVAFLAGGDVLASVSGGNAGGLCELRIWKPDGSTIAAFEPHERRITSLAVSPDGKTVALGSQDKAVSLWDVSEVIAEAAKRRPVEARRP